MHHLLGIVVTVITPSAIPLVISLAKRNLFVKRVPTIIQLREGKIISGSGDNTLKVLEIDDMLL